MGAFFLGLIPFTFPCTTPSHNFGGHGKAMSVCLLSVLLPIFAVLLRLMPSYYPVFIDLLEVWVRGFLSHRQNWLGLSLWVAQASDVTVPSEVSYTYDLYILPQHQSLIPSMEREMNLFQLEFFMIFTQFITQKTY